MDSHAVEQFRELMNEIGAIEDFGLVVGDEDLPLWQVVIGQTDLPILIEVDDARQLVVLSSDLGAAAKDEEVDKINALALDYAALYATTAGARIARNGDDRTYSLIADFGVASLTRATLGDVLRRFATMSAGWRDIVAGQAQPQPAADGASGPDAFFIRI